MLDSYSKTLIGQFVWGQNSSSIWCFILECRFLCFIDCGSYDIYFYFSGRQGFKSAEMKSEYRCEYQGCGKIFQSRANYKSHVQSLHVTGLFKYKNFPCDKCDIVYEGPNHLLMHAQTVHNNIPPFLQPWANYKCEICNRRFLSTGKKNAHKAHQHPKNPKLSRGYRKTPLHKCPYCDKFFRAQTAFVEHVKATHENDTPYDCKFCSRKFGTKHVMNSHIATVHTKVTCDICGQLQYNKFYLKRHKGSAHGIIPPGSLKCKYCTEWFTFRTNLEKHIENKHRN